MYENKYVHSKQCNTLACVFHVYMDFKRCIHLRAAQSEMFLTVTNMAMTEMVVIITASLINTIFLFALPCGSNTSEHFEQWITGEDVSHVNIEQKSCKRSIVKFIYLFFLFFLFNPHY